MAFDHLIIIFKIISIFYVFNKSTPHLLSQNTPTLSSKYLLTFLVKINIKSLVSLTEEEQNEEEGRGVSGEALNM